MAELGDAKLTDLLVTLANCPKARSPSIHAGAGRATSAKDRSARTPWSRRQGSLLALALHHFDTGANFFVGHVQTELKQYRYLDGVLVSSVRPVSVSAFGGAQRAPFTG
jgi:hypothetical protein